jgi:lipoyl(octanoyl) transferase
MTGSRTVALHRADGVDYSAALDWQRTTAEAVRSARESECAPRSEALALIEHQPVYTLGARATDSNVLEPRAALAARGAEVLSVDRGGDVTFHGPGQLVAYPILDLHDRGIRPGDYVRLLEQTVIDTLAVFDLDGERVRGRPGVWVAGAKVAAIGVRVSRGVSTHGLALNVSTDLDWFDAIVPCGIVDAEVSSMMRLLGSVAPTFEAVVGSYRTAFEALFESQLLDVDDRPLRFASTEVALA